MAANTILNTGTGGDTIATDDMTTSKAQRIKTLLLERETRTKEHGQRLDAIAAELKTLGHRRSRVAKKQTAEKAAGK